MKILLDSHVLIWLAYNQSQHFSDRIIQMFENDSHEFFVSVASIWEICIKASLSKPNFDINPEEFVKKLGQTGIKTLPIEIQHTFNIAKLPRIHNDPFDRLLLVQAEREKLQFFTADNLILQYNKPFVIDVRV